MLEYFPRKQSWRFLSRAGQGPGWQEILFSIWGHLRTLGCREAWNRIGQQVHIRTGTVCSCGLRVVAEGGFLHCKGWWASCLSSRGQRASAAREMLTECGLHMSGPCRPGEPVTWERAMSGEARSQKRVLGEHGIRLILRLNLHKCEYSPEALVEESGLPCHGEAGQDGWGTLH